MEASTGDISNGANGQDFLQQVQHLLPHWREQTSALESCQLPISPLLDTICKMARLALRMYCTATCYCSTLINSNSSDGWQWCALHSQNTESWRAHGNKCGQQMDSSLSSWCLSRLNDSNMRWPTCENVGNLTRVTQRFNRSSQGLQASCLNLLWPPAIGQVNVCYIAVLSQESHVVTSHVQVLVTMLTFNLHVLQPKLRSLLCSSTLEKFFFVVVSSAE